ncbi:BTAD domain-containing putative transcriptional regulator, partial [Nocardioides sp.]|uniref:AfsR/SARP family transcriptional regulator n=1 Tax=Nocardioides sp. TaxID=35761 RepID=UPI003784E3C2
MQVSVLGPVEVVLDGAPVDLGTPKQRALVAALALSRGWPVSVDAIVDLLWGDASPPGVTATLQAYVSQLRRVIEPDRQRRAPATVLVTVAPGYALRVPDESVDVHRFEQVVAATHRRLQPVGWGRSPLDAGVLAAEVAALDEALALWRGTPYAELGDADPAVAERARLEELRLVALEDRAVAGLALGHHATVAAELEALTAAYPLRERLWALRALALTRSGRQADALEVLRRVREVLDEELGLEPSAELRDLQTAVLRQDPDLEWVAPEAGPAPAPEPGPAPPDPAPAPPATPAPPAP